MLKNKGKEYFTAFLCSLAANIGLMILFYFLHAKQGMFAGLDVARYTSIVIVLTAIVAGIVCHVRSKKKDGSTGSVISVSLISFVAAFAGCVSGAAIAANLFGKISG